VDMRDNILGIFITKHFQAAMKFNPLTQELNLSAQRCLPKCFTGDFNF
jgi:hypothetical protein